MKKKGNTGPTNNSTKSDRKASLPEREEVHGELASSTANEHESTEVETQKISESKIINESKKISEPKVKGLSKKSDQSSNRGSRINLRPPSRYIPSVVRHYVWMRDRGVCTHKDPRTGLKCESNYRLQYDHIESFSLGGASMPENLRLLCQAHSTPEQALNKGVRIPRPELFIHGSSRRLVL